MFDYYFTFRSVTPAQRAQGALQNAHIPSDIRRLPKFLSARGCGYAVIVGAAYGTAAARVLRDTGTTYSSVYKLSFDGNYEEVHL